MKTKIEQGWIYLWQKKYTSTSKTLTRDKDGFYVMIKELVHQEEITNIYMYPEQKKK